MTKIRNKAFLMYFSDEQIYANLPDDLVGKLLKAMFRYAIDGEEKFDLKEHPLLYGVFLAWKVQFDLDNKKYIEAAIRKQEYDRERYNKRKKEDQEEEPQKEPEEEFDEEEYSDKPF